MEGQLEAMERIQHEAKVKQFVLLHIIMLKLQLFVRV